MIEKVYRKVHLIFCSNLYRLKNRLYKAENILYWHKSDNFGDAINPLFFQKLTSRKIIYRTQKKEGVEHFLGIGSILDKATASSVVWGSGFISETSECKAHPKKVYAVRGPKSRDRLLQQGINCPEIYGDPALLLPRIYFPKVKKKYKLGVIPHFTEKDSKLIEKFVLNQREVIVIDLQVCNPFAVIDKILQCEKIISSSLHGIIVSDAYSIPSLWIEVHGDLVGGHFKFFDYFMSVNRTDKEPYKMNNNTTIDEVTAQFKEYKIQINLDELLKALPEELQQ